MTLNDDAGRHGRGLNERLQITRKVCWTPYTEYLVKHNSCFLKISLKRGKFAET